ncbi:acetyltransferase [Leptospira biflexa]|uniref:acetyltransferase n=1 Tax=Leptospira biflexa TaxID=172 RepID=UPI0010910703|nr:acetyltransferase [Leptospira biflexa]TGM53968.1 acetyltransferase [Leptospira biflexa]
MKEPLLLIGAGGHTKSCIEVIESEDRYQIIGLVGSESEKGKEILGYKVIGSDEDLFSLKSVTLNVLITIGQIKSHELRKRSYDFLKSMGFRFVTIISPSAKVSRMTQIGEGTVIFHNCILNSEVIVGKNCIINTGVILEHEVEIGEHTHISTGAILNGGVKVGSHSFVGSGTVVKENVVIGSNVVVGMSSKVLKSIPDHTVFI